MALNNRQIFHAEKLSEPEKDGPMLITSDHCIGGFGGILSNQNPSTLKSRVARELMALNYRLIFHREKLSEPDKRTYA